MLRVKGHKSLYRTFLRKTDAKLWLTQEKAHMQKGTYLDSYELNKNTLNDALSKFISEETVKQSRVVHLNRWKNEIGHKTLSLISEIPINSITTKWRNFGFEGKNLGAATINAHIHSLSVLFEHCRRWGWIKVNSARLARKYEETDGRVRYLTENEREALLRACKSSSYKPLELIVTLALSTGMRKEELLSLQWHQVDLSNGVVILHKTKNKTKRRVYIRGQALELLRGYSKIRKIDSAFLFPAQFPSPINAKNSTPQTERHFDIRKSWKAACKRAELKDFRFHDLRHSCASYLAMNGASTLEIAEVLGHRTLEVVKRYAHLSDSHTAMVVEKMNRRFLSGANG